MLAIVRFSSISRNCTLKQLNAPAANIPNNTHLIWINFVQHAVQVVADTKKKTTHRYRRLIVVIQRQKRKDDDAYLNSCT